ncbi:GNAT family N-acetyltransferase [Herbidospora sp. NEAU-GS84]|uniref:GNAT family N-acetyltransferase n=1 Tax=Herbidospora solisilvae TaxID=2696284 RepID=A0A7C9JA12_9ACTN|nr:GNAT family N-acetyltransferase [Herbidospora solisilvae]NAS20561.1 GNAT family N-acetyltransferase [Herbidospora solisilvae]
MSIDAMQGLTSRLWFPGARWHVGDLAWGLRQHTGREHEWPTKVWRSNGQVVAWGWAELPGHLNLQAVDEHWAGAVLDWFGEITEPESVVVSSAEPHLVRAVEARGFVQMEGPFFLHLVRDLEDLPEPRAACHPVTDVAGRVRAHREAFYPSRVTEESYRNVQKTPPYRGELDVVADVDGETAAYCLAWLDDARKAVLIEPVGTVPDHRGKGLARDVCLAALHAARDLGAEIATVSPRGDDAWPIPARLYRSIGFAQVARTVHYGVARG